MAALNSPFIIQYQGTARPVQFIIPTQWYAPWREPVRLPVGLKPYLHAYDLNKPFTPPPPAPDEGYVWWGDPVRFPVGLRPYYQQFFTFPPRVLPTPDVTVVIAATEVNADEALFGVNVVSGVTPISQSGAAVTIIEIVANDDGGVSIREP